MEGKFSSEGATSSRFADAVAVIAGNLGIYVGCQGGKKRSLMLV